MNAMTITKLGDLSTKQITKAICFVTSEECGRIATRAAGLKRLVREMGGRMVIDRDVLAHINGDDTAPPLPDAAEVILTHTNALDPAGEDLADDVPDGMKRDSHGFIRRDNKDAKAADRPKRKNRVEEVAALLRQDDGATLQDIMGPTGWLAHTTRAFLSKGGALRKAGHHVCSAKVERDGKKVTIYSLT